MLKLIHLLHQNTEYFKYFFSGRFDFHVQLSSPAVSERGAILKHEIEKRTLLCSEDVVSEIATKCDGYDAYDLVLLSFSLVISFPLCFVVFVTYPLSMMLVLMDI